MPIENRMLFAINYSYQAAALLSEKRIKVDRFKCPDWPDMISEASFYCQVAVHTNLKAGRGKLTNKDWEMISHLLEKTQTPFVNLHLETRSTDFPGIPVDTIDPIHTEQITEQILKDLEIAIGRFGRERVIAENVPYRSTYGEVLRPVSDPSVIHQIIIETGVGLLLDISHARISAHYMSMNEHEYISGLPVKLLKELHFTGVQDQSGRLQDHLGAQEADWEVLNWVIQNIREGKWSMPWLLAFEYGGVGEKFLNRSDPKIIEEQSNCLYDKVQRLNFSRSLND